KRRITGGGGRRTVDPDRPVPLALPRLITHTHAALAKQFEDFELGKYFCQFIRRRRHEPRVGRCRRRRRWRILFCVETSFPETLRAQTLRRIHGNRFQASVAESCRSHINPSIPFVSTPYRRIPRPSLQPHSLPRLRI